MDNIKYWNQGVDTVTHVYVWIVLATMAIRKAKVEFSEQERLELVKAYDGGMDSVAKTRLQKIQDLSVKFGKEESAIQVGRYLPYLVPTSLL